MILGALFLWAAVLVFERGAEMNWTPTAIFSVGYLTLMGTVVTFGLFYWLLRYATASKMALIAYVIPVVALVLGVVIGHEPVGVETLIGTSMILGGVILARIFVRS